MTTTTQTLWSGVFSQDTIEITFEENSIATAAGYSGLRINPNAPVETVFATISSNNPNLTFGLSEWSSNFYRLENGQLKRGTDEVTWEWRARGNSMDDSVIFTVTDGVSVDSNLYFSFKLSRSPAVAAVYGFGPGAATQLSVNQIYQDDWYSESDYSPASRIVFDTLHGKTEQPFASMQFVDTANYPSTDLKITAEGHIGFTAQPALGQRSVKVRFANEMGTLDYLVTFTVIAGTSYPANLVTQLSPTIFSGATLDVTCARPAYRKTNLGAFFNGDLPAGSIAATLSTLFSGSVSYSLTHPLFELVGNEIRKKESASWANSGYNQTLELVITVDGTAETCNFYITIDRAPPAQCALVALVNNTIFSTSAIPLEPPLADLGSAAGTSVYLTIPTFDGLPASALPVTGSFIETNTYPTSDYSLQFQSQWVDVNGDNLENEQVVGLRIKSVSDSFTLGTHTVKVRIANDLGYTDHLVSFTVTEPPASWATPTGPVTWKILPLEIATGAGTTTSNIDIFIKTIDGLAPAISSQGTKDTVVHNIDFTGGTYVVVNGETFVATDFHASSSETIWPTNSSVNNTDKIVVYRGKLYAPTSNNTPNGMLLKLMNADGTIRKGTLRFGRGDITVLIQEDPDNDNLNVVHQYQKTMYSYLRYWISENTALDGGSSGGGSSGGGSSGGGSSGGGSSGGGSSGGGSSGGSTTLVSGAAVVNGKAIGNISVDPRTTAVRVTIAGVEQIVPTDSVLKHATTGQKFIKIDGDEFAFTAISLTVPTEWKWNEGGQTGWEVLQSI